MNSNSTASSLAEKLQQKTKQDREQIESLILKELESLSETLRKQSIDELNTTEAAIKQRSRDLLKNINQALNEHQSQAESLTSLLGRSWIMLTVIGLSLFLGILGGSWGLTTYLSSSIRNQLEQKAELSQEVDQLQQTLARIEAKTWGVVFSESKDGRFLILPAGVTAQTGWTFNNGKQQGVKLGKN